MLGLTPVRRGVEGARGGPGRAILVAVMCFVRGLPLFFSSAPGTPLRLLCIVALDALHVFRCAKPLPRERRQCLATFLDFQAGTNKVWDRKNPRAHDLATSWPQLDDPGLRSRRDAYLAWIRELETRRPAPGGDRRRFDDVRAYREAVVRVSLAAAIAIALDAESLDAAIETTHRDADAAALFQLAMQCQVIDDVLDYAEDRSLGLPTFLTASASLSEAISLTAGVARSYGVTSPMETRYCALPIRLALHAVTAIATGVVIAARWQLAASSQWTRLPGLRAALRRAASRPSKNSSGGFLP